MISYEELAAENVGLLGIVKALKEENAVLRSMLPSGLEIFRNCKIMATIYRNSGPDYQNRYIFPYFCVKYHSNYMSNKSEFFSFLY